MVLDSGGTDSMSSDKSAFLGDMGNLLFNTCVIAPHSRLEGGYMWARPEYMLQRTH